jgi:aminopeptidase N
VFRGEGVVGLMGGSDLSMFNKTVVAHEIGHQWWGSLIGNANNRNYWFSETLAEYFSALWVETVYGDKEGPELYKKKVDEWRKTVLDNELTASVKRSASDYMGEFPGPARQALIYNKGPLAFHMLRTIFGDEKFSAMIAPFVKDLAEKREIVTLDIQRAAERHLGGVDANGNPYNVDLSWFFDQWILDIGIPEYSLHYATRRNEEGKWLIEGVVKQRVVYGSRIEKREMPGVMYRAVVPITAVGKKDQRWAKNLVVESAETPFRLLVPERPLEVILNENHATLAHDVLVNQDF